MPISLSIPTAADARLGQSYRPLAPLANETAQTPDDLQQITRQSDFSSILSRQTGKKGTPAQQARQAAEDFVSVAFVQPILKQLRSTNSAAPPFAPGPGEKQFMSLADAQTARQLVRASNWSVVKHIEQQILRTTDRVQPGSPADIRRREQARAAGQTTTPPANPGQEGQVR